MNLEEQFTHFTNEVGRLAREDPRRVSAKHHLSDAKIALESFQRAMQRVRRDLAEPAYSDKITGGSIVV